MADIEITPLRRSLTTRAMLSEILIEVVAEGGSVSFMHPLKPAAANAYWDHALAAATLDQRVVLGAWDGDVLAGTVTLLLDLPQNQSTGLRPPGANPADARHGCRRRCCESLSAAGVHVDGRNPRLRAQTSRRIDRDADLLEADRRCEPCRRVVKCHANR